MLYTPTFVNGRRIQQVLLRGGEEIRVGQTRLRYVDPSMLPPGAVPRTASATSTGPTAYFAVLSADGREFQQYAVTPKVVLGRYAGCPVDLSADALVSQRHAQLGHQDGRWYIADLDSHNGTYINDARTGTAWLKDGDVVRLGNTRMRFHG